MRSEGISETAVLVVRCANCGNRAGFGVARVLPDGRVMCRWCEERVDVFELLSTTRTEIVR